MRISEINKRIVLKISKIGTDDYVALPEFQRRFSYPVSLELSEYAGKTVYQKGFADMLEFLCLMANKFYTHLRASSDTNILESFISSEDGKIEEKTRTLVTVVKKWEMGFANNDQLAEAMNKFCLDTYGVRMPMVSFFLRMLLPDKFGTLDVHAINALKSLGFKVKKIPPSDLDKEEYFRQYNAQDYLEYNQLLKEIGRHYKVPSKLGGYRDMRPSEVDMALYEYDKASGRLERMPVVSMKGLSKEEKIEAIMSIVQEVVRGTRTGPSWVRKAGESFLINMRSHAREGKLNSMFSYCSRLAKGSKGKGVRDWLESRGLPSIETRFEEIERIYEDC